MPKINVYLPDALAEAVKEAQLPVSSICQAALETAIQRVQAAPHGIIPHVAASLDAHAAQQRRVHAVPPLHRRAKFALDRGE